MTVKKITPPFLQDKNSFELCRYAIITDTVNFSEGAKKATPSDEEVIKELDKKLAKSSKERTNDYQLILKAKQDTKNLTVMQCLRKDLKVSLPASDNYKFYEFLAYTTIGFLQVFR